MNESLPKVPTPVVIRAWRWRSPLDPMQWLFALLFISALGAFCAAFGVLMQMAATLHNTERFFNSWWRISLAVLIAFIPLGLLLIALDWIGKASRQRTVRRLSTSDPARGFYAACCLYGDLPREAWWARRRRRWLGRLRAESDARVFIHARYLKRIAGYTVTQHPVEPERIGSAFAMSEMRVLLGGSIACAYLGWTFGLFLVVGPAIAMCVAGWRLFKRSGFFTPTIAGQGWIEQGSKRWTVADSVVVVTGMQRADVRIVGDPGVLRLRLDARPGADGELATFWTRWMHPLPDLTPRTFDA